jgi:hypothetical protein
MVVHDDPIDPSDSGWQFLCGEGETEPPSVWMLSELIEKFPDVRVLLDQPVGRSFVREREGAEWVAYEGEP